MTAQTGPSDARPEAGVQASDVDRSGRRAVGLFSVTLLLSAGLTFLVQPMFARFVLPLLGSSPAVWTTALLFFQATLLLGYAYADFSSRRLGVRRQVGLHLVLLLVPLLFLPIAVPDDWRPPVTGDPVLPLLGLLAASVGLPFFAVSATAPLLQRWLAETELPAGRDPYFLYRASNLGSALGLLGYPLVLEPLLGLDGQGWAWAVGYGLLVLLIVGCAAVVWRFAPRAGGTAPARDDVAVPEVAGEEAAPAEAARLAPPTATRRLRWVVLALVPSSLVLGLTTYLTTDLAPVPLLWAIPLALYLLSFALVFSPGAWTARLHERALGALPVLAALVVAQLLFELRSPIALIGLLHLTTFFAAALVCHGELARDRPAPRDLTGFYLLVAVGGALGGLVNAVVAPLAFDALVEYPLALVLACGLGPVRSRLPATSWTRRLDLLLPLAVGLVVAGLLALAGLRSEEAEGLGRGFIFGGAIGLAINLGRRPVRFALTLAALLVAGTVVSADRESLLYAERTFFGVHQVRLDESGTVFRLQHGTTTHGLQDRTPGRALTPLSYYERIGPLGQLMSSLPNRAPGFRAAVVGLGSGTMACHSRSGEPWTFYEIDPEVERIARDPRLFTFLRDCPGRFDVVLGDARRSLSRAPDHRLGLLVVDAFTSDAIPVHLLTREALALYRRTLSRDGVLVVNVSNRYLNLAPVLGDLARDADMTCAGRAESRREAEKVEGKFASRWVALANRPADLGPVARDPRWRACGGQGDGRPWTDDRSDVLGAFGEG